MAYCNRNTLVNWDGKTVIAHPLRCKCWSCAYCNPWRRDMLVKEAVAGKPSTFITLTSNPNNPGTPDEHAVALVEAWRIVVRRMKQQLRLKSVQYLVVIEKTQRGEPHLHILARMRRVEQRWLSEQMQELIGAPIVDIRRVAGKRAAARYVSKYIGKDPHAFEGCKRYWRSLNYMHPTRAELRAQRDPNAVYFMVTQDFTSYSARLRIAGWMCSKSHPSTLEVTHPDGARAPPGCPERQKERVWDPPS